MKLNVEAMNKEMEKWKEPMFERKPKPMPPDELIQQHAASIENRFETIIAQGKEIHKKLKETETFLKPDKKSIEWVAYVDYINGLAIEGITLGINASLNSLIQNLNINQGFQMPMFDLKIDLFDRRVQFDPSVASNDNETGIRDIINKIVRDIVSLATKMQRLDSQGQAQTTGDYLVEIRDQFELFFSI